MGTLCQVSVLGRLERANKSKLDEAKPRRKKAEKCRVKAIQKCRGRSGPNMCVRSERNVTSRGLFPRDPRSSKRKWCRGGDVVWSSMAGL